MRMIACLFLVLSCAACAVGQPASLAPASRQAIAPVQTFGFNPVVRQGLTIPIDTAACITETGVNVVRDVVQGLRCVLDTLVPIVAPPQSVIQTAPQSAPCAPMVPTYAPVKRSSAPGCEPVATGSVCASGNCSTGR